VLRAPTPHPLATFVGWLVAPFGTSSDRLLVLLSLLVLVGLLVVLFRFTQRLLSTLTAVVALVVMLTRTDLNLLGPARDLRPAVLRARVRGRDARAAQGRGRAGRCSRCWAGGACCGRRRGSGRGLLALARPATPRKTLAWLALLVAVPPLLWMLADVIVVGEPLYSLTKTREVAGEFGRQRGSARPSA
jgi:hypothetical protein